MRVLKIGVTTLTNAGLFTTKYQVWMMFSHFIGLMSTSNNSNRIIDKN